MVSELNRLRTSTLQSFLQTDQTPFLYITNELFTKIRKLVLFTSVFQSVLSVHMKYYAMKGSEPILTPIFLDKFSISRR